MISLQKEAPFARGGNRLCFVHPEFPDRVIKVRRPDFTLEDMRRRKGFPRNLRPLSSFDENLKEVRIMREVEARLGDSAYTVLPRLYGFVETDMGPGLCSELIRNADGKISRSVMQYVWEQGLTPTLSAAVERFEAQWLPLMTPTRDVLLHNVAAQCDAEGNILRLVVIDGLNDSGLVPYRWLPPAMKTHRARKKITRFKALIDALVETRKTGIMPSTFWQLRHDGLSRRDNGAAR